MNSFSPQLFTRRAATCLLAGAALLFPNPFAAHAEVLIKDGQKLAFMGDSITEGGWRNPGGYVRLTIAGLEANGAKVTPIPAGIGGHKSDQMLARLKKDVLEKKPDFMTLSCGVNDVWHGARGVLLDQYKVNITAIVDQCAAAGVKVVILTATVIFEELDNTTTRSSLPTMNSSAHSPRKKTAARGPLLDVCRSHQNQNQARQRVHFRRRPHEFSG